MNLLLKKTVGIEPMNPLCSFEVEAQTGKHTREGPYGARLTPIGLRQRSSEL